MIQLRTHVATGFDELPESARALIAAAPSYDLTLPWFEAMARHTLKPGESLELLWLAGESDAEALAVLPTVRSDHGAAPIHRRSLRGLSNYYSGWFAPLLAPAADPARLTQALAQSLMRDVEHWESLDLNPMDPQDPLFLALGRSPMRGCFVQRYFRFGNWYLAVGDRSYDEYLRGLPSRLQNTLKRKARKIDQLGPVRYEIMQTTDGLDAVLTAYEDVYAKSWKRGVEASPVFVREVAHEFAQRGWLRLGVLWVGTRAAATQLWFVYNRTASIFKLAYDPEYAEHSVGSLLTAHLMRHVIDVDHVQTIDYLMGDDAYKRDWMSARRERWGLRIYRLGSVAGFAGAARSVAGSLARRGLSAVRRAGSRSVS